jgi:DNA-binding winged helix-turn-helix (wHTH) protein/tetratricopeptide (TPR) repeat protein/energy-coupling factor transporter ATP-binding protein EcfA2
MPKKPPLDQAQFRVGDAMVHPERLVISINDEEHPIEPRIMEVLIALASAAQNNETLSAVNLYIRAWIGGAHAEGNAPDPRIDVMQAENPVHKAITHLRKVFGDDPKSPRYIETIRKRGYRLVAPVVYQDHYRRVAVARKNWTTGSPYVGLNAFDSRHASVFLGRSRTTGELIEAVRRQIDQQRRLVLVVGASGCGKTSLVNAGAIPILTEKGGYDGLRALSVARCDLAGTRREDALPRLAAALMQWTLDRREILPPQPVETLAGTLRGQPESLPDTLEDAFRRHASRDMSALSHPHLLLVIDHAEAIVADPSFGSDDHAEIDRFLHHLCESRHVCVIVIVRGDFYLALAEALPGMTERKSGDGHVDVLAPRTGEIGDIIRIPAASAGLEFQQHPESKDYLDDVLLRAAVAQPDALPLLQHTLQMLYERRNGRNQLCFDAYHEIGGLEGALSHHAEHVFTGLPDEIQASLDQVLSRMVVMQPENDRVSARRIPRGALDARAIALAEAFVQARLFVAEHENGDAHYRVAHEALLRQWPRAVDWIRENRRILLARIRLQRAAARWAEEGRRDDHLLNPGAPLEEAIAVSNFQEISNEDTADFLRRSIHGATKKKRLRISAIAVLLTLAATSMLLSVFATRKSIESAKRKDIAQDFIGFMLNDVNSAIDPTGDLVLPERISKKALSHYQSIEYGQMDEGDLANFASALRGLGIVRLSQGKIDESMALFNKSADTVLRSLHINPKSEAALYEDCQSHYWIGYIHYIKNDFKKAKTEWNRYLSSAESLRSISPKNPDWILEESYALNNLGALSFRIGDMESAALFFRKDIEKKQVAISINPNSFRYRMEYADSRSWMSSSVESNGKIKEAGLEYDDQLSELKRLSIKEIHYDKWKFRIARLLQLKATNSIMNGDLVRAAQEIDESIEILSSLVTKNDSQSDWQHSLVRGHVIRAEIDMIRQNLPSTQSHLAAATQAIGRANAETTLTPPWKRLRHYIRFMSAIHRTEGPDITTAKLASEDMKSLLEDEPSTEIAMDYARMKITLSQTYSMTRDTRRSLSAAEDAITALKAIDYQKGPQWNHYWIQAHTLLGRHSDVAENVLWLDHIRYQHPGYRSTHLKTTPEQSRM